MNPLPHKIKKIFFNNDLSILTKEVLSALTDRTLEAVLIWDDSCPGPSESLLASLLSQPADVWHSGLKLGMCGLPSILDFVQPVKTSNLDTSPDIKATSWRISLRACLIRADVIRHQGWLWPGFKTPEGAALEMGHRWITSGVLMRYVPELVSETKLKKFGGVIPFEDELRFIFYRFGNKWPLWTLFRAITSQYVSLRNAAGAMRMLSRTKPQEPAPYRARGSKLRAPISNGQENHRVTVLIPTLNRYSYLEKVLNGLKKQTIKPFEVIVIDQSRKEIRRNEFYENFSDLPFKVIYQDEPGQCSSRNAGLEISQGDYVLFLDDDDEIQADLIEKHLETITQFQCEVSSGIAQEVGAGALPASFTYLRQSDVFPTNNTMIERKSLKKSGLFDLAYNRKQRADADLGVRVYLSGAQMILNPDISVLHHHAAEGGLRAHGARKITYAASRKSLWVRHLPSDSEIYLSMRYFNARQVKEMFWLKGFQTFSFPGNKLEKFLRALIAFIFLPNTLFVLSGRKHSALKMLKCYPKIAQLEGFQSDNKTT